MVSNNIVYNGGYQRVATFVADAYSKKSRVLMSCGAEARTRHLGVPRACFRVPKSPENTRKPYELVPGTVCTKLVSRIQIPAPRLSAANAIIAHSMHVGVPACPLHYPVPQRCCMHACMVHSPHLGMGTIVAPRALGETSRNVWRRSASSNTVVGPLSSLFPPPPYTWDASSSLHTNG